MLVKIFILCLFIIVLLEGLYQQPIYNESFGSSPSIVHQELPDRKNDWILVKQPSNDWQYQNGTITKVKTETNKTECTDPDPKNKFFPPDIGAVTYLSDGSSLNGTIWLTTPLEVLPFHKKGYTISVFVIDSSSFYDIGSDYFVRFYKDPYTQNWTRNISETSSSMFRERVIDTTNYTGLINYGQSYIPISFNLSHMNFPTQFKLIFTAWDKFINKNQKFCYLQDMSTKVQIPPPQYSITTLPTSAVLRPQEEKEIELSIKSIGTVAFDVTLKDEKIEDLTLNFTPETLFVPANKALTSIMKIKLLDDTEKSYEKDVIFKILSEIKDFFVLDDEDEKSYKKLKSVPINLTLAVPTRGGIFNNVTMTNEPDWNITYQHIFQLEILPPVTIFDYLKILADQVVSPLSTVYAFIATLITAIATVSTIIIRKKSKKSLDWA